MKGYNYILLLFIFSLFQVISAQNTQKPLDFDFCHYTQINFAKQNKIESKLPENLDLIYGRLKWFATPTNYYIQGEVTWHFKSLQNIDTLIFDLSDTLKVDSVKWKNTLLDFNLVENQLKINHFVLQNEIDSVTIYYRGTPISSGFGSFITNTLDNKPILWTLSEPYGAQDWFPCRQILTDKIDSLDIFITTDSSFQAISNGILQSIDIQNDKKIFHWKHRYKIAYYLIAIAISNYNQINYYFQNPEGDSTLVENYVMDSDLGEFYNSIPEQQEVAKIFGHYFGRYPFAKEKYGQVQFGWGGGIEHQTCTFTGKFWYELLAHELAHQWFGDFVTCGSWQDLWLNEGFATYCSGLGYEKMFQGQWWPVFLDGRHGACIAELGGSVFAYDTLNNLFSSRFRYNKPAMVLHEIRFLIGDDAFFQGIKNYLQDRQFGCAITENLKYHLEQTGKQDLTKIFDQWIYKEGYPTYYGKWSQKGKNINLDLQQTTSHSSVTCFQQEMEIYIYGKNVNQIQSPQIHRIKINQNQHNFVLEGFEIIDSIKFDPNRWLIKGKDSLDKVFNPEIQFFPNPTQNILWLTCPYPETLKQIQITDAIGRKIQIPFSQFNTQIKIDLSGFAKGMYLIEVVFPFTKIIEKIIVD